VKALSDYLINFTFGIPIHFGSPEATGAVIPYLLKRVWDQENDRRSLLWEMGQHGVVSGDVFVKVAYEPPYEDPNGQEQPGRIRILPLNPAHCFPEFHPHDRSRFTRFKLKYKFWGCVDSETEILTDNGWKRYDEVTTSDYVLSRNPTSDAVQWERPKAINVHEAAGSPMVRWTGQGIDAVTTLDHRWLALATHGSHKNGTYRKEREIVRTEVSLDGQRAVKNSDQLLLGGGVSDAFAWIDKYDDELVETLAWFVTEGCVHTNQTGFKSVLISQSERANPDYVRRIRQLAEYWREKGATVTERTPDKNGVITWYFGKGANEEILGLAPDKGITPNFLMNLTYPQAELFHRTLLDADGNRRGQSTRWTQTHEGRVDAFQMLTAMLGIRSRYAGEKVTEYHHDVVGYSSVTAERVACPDIIWCPTLSEETGIWMARRNGVTYWTGNTGADGTRQIHTFTEIITDESVEEYINDDLIDRRPNPLGRIPIAFTPNISVASSPWGLSDIQDIISLNREFNEKATEVSDIINYHAAPVTVVTGAKASNLEKGPKKVWAIGNKDARVQNLAMETNLSGPLGYMELLKTAMHEMTGVPMNALGQSQPVSNTSGTALHMTYFPLMQRHSMKSVQYTKLFKAINELIIRTAVVFDPDSLAYNPQVAALQPKVGQYMLLDPRDPATYESTVEWTSPLPMDTLVKLNEVQGLMTMGLESKRGALKAMGSAFPDQKLQEIFSELLEDAKMQGALGLTNAQVSQFILAATGFTADGQPVVVPGTEQTDGEGNPTGMAPAVDPQLAQEVMMHAYAIEPPARVEFEEE
jgi:hypothetical protein